RAPPDHSAAVPHRGRLHLSRRRPHRRRPDVGHGSPCRPRRPDVPHRLFPRRRPGRDAPRHRSRHHQRLRPRLDRQRAGSGGGVEIRMTYSRFSNFDFRFGGNPMTETEMKRRTKSFALRVLALIDALPEKRSARVLAHQVGRSGTSVGANYRAACRAKSAADMINKLTIVEEEADETGFWLELI